jgi:hypothetical protein
MDIGEPFNSYSEDSKSTNRYTEKIKPAKQRKG